jgi:hypothetical protein
VLPILVLARDKAKEGLYGGEPSIARANRVAALGLQIDQEIKH